MGVEITVALSDREIELIWEAQETVTMNIRNYEKKKRDAGGKMPAEEYAKYDDLAFKEILLHKITGLIENETEKNIMRARASKRLAGELNVEVSTGDIEHIGKLCNTILQNLQSPKETSQGQEKEVSNGFLSLSGKELKEQVNKWIVHHVENDINLSPGYFERLLRGWEAIYRRQCGMSMLDAF